MRWEKVETKIIWPRIRLDSYLILSFGKETVLHKILSAKYFKESHVTFKLEFSLSRLHHALLKVGSSSPCVLEPNIQFPCCFGHFMDYLGAWIDLISLESDIDSNFHIQQCTLYYAFLILKFKIYFPSAVSSPFKS